MSDQPKQKWNMSPGSWIAIIVGLAMATFSIVLNTQASAVQQRVSYVEAKNDAQDATDQKLMTSVNANTTSIQVILTELKAVNQNISEVKDLVKAQRGSK